jgi:hypothetical protein
LRLNLCRDVIFGHGVSLYAVPETKFPEEVTTLVSNRRTTREGFSRRKIQMQAKITTALKGRRKGAAGVGTDKDEDARKMS